MSDRIFWNLSQHNTTWPKTDAKLASLFYAITYSFISLIMDSFRSSVRMSIISLWEKILTTMPSTAQFPPHMPSFEATRMHHNCNSFASLALASVGTSG